MSRAYDLSALNSLVRESTSVKKVNQVFKQQFSPTHRCEQAVITLDLLHVGDKVDTRNKQRLLNLKKYISRLFCPIYRGTWIDFYFRNAHQVVR